jgi:hypothetical protein
MEALWTFASRRSGFEHTSPLSLVWEVHGDPISDNWDPAEISARELFALWLERYYPEPASEALCGSGMVAIHWFVRSRAGIEIAPFQATASKLDGTASQSEDFLTHFTEPFNANSSEPVNWIRLPVIDKLWREGRGDKGGFIQEATGWKPSPLQTVVHIPSLLAAAGIDTRHTI